MKKKQTAFGSRNGATLIVVMCLAMLGTLAASSVVLSVGSRMRESYSQLNVEKAFYIATAGIERSASRVAGGNNTSGTLSGSIGDGSYVAAIDSQPQTSGDIYFNVTSVGTANGISRSVTLRGLRHVSWARYALWYDTEATKLWIVPGERFDGRVYSKPQFHFHDQNLATKGQVVFTDKAWTAAATIETASSAVNPIFQQGLTTSAPLESMASVDFTALYTAANTSGLVLDGATTIVLNGATLTITNSRKSWTSKAVAIPANGLIYVRTVTSGTTSTRTGDISVSAPSGLLGRLTLVSDNDIKITDHIRYQNNPATVPTSTDALGLVAKRNVEVQTSAPNNLDIYAHIICQTGGFGVASYSSGSSRGTLNVYGGIVNSVRNAVGTTSGTGYSKNYVFDKRFTKNPPPSYPVLNDELEWTEWEG